MERGGRFCLQRQRLFLYLFAVKPKRPAGFLNVDLEILSSYSLDLLAGEFGKVAVILYSGPGEGGQQLLCLESLRCPDTPETAARALCRAVERLSPEARGSWDRARRKALNVGYELPSGVRSVQITLEPATLRRIVALGATVAFTCYRNDNGEPQPADLLPPPSGAGE